MLISILLYCIFMLDKYDTDCILAYCMLIFVLKSILAHHIFFIHDKLYISLFIFTMNDIDSIYYIYIIDKYINSMLVYGIFIF